MIDIAAFNAKSLDDRINDFYSEHFFSLYVIYKVEKDGKTTEIFSDSDINYATYYISVEYSKSGEVLDIKASRYIINAIRQQYKEYWDKWVRENDDIIFFEGQSQDHGWATCIMYVDCDYKKSLSVVSDFLMENSLFEEDSDKKPLYSGLEGDASCKWKETEEHNSAVVYLCRADVDCLGSGHLFVVNDTASILSNRRSLPASIPLSILNRCKHLPNIIKVHFTNRFLYYFEGLAFAKGLAEFAARKNVSIYMLELDEKLMHIKNGQNNRGVIYEQLHLQLMDYINDDVLSEVYTMVEEKYKDVFAKLSPNSKTFLLTAYKFYEVFRQWQPSLIDCSPICIELSKTIETEIGHKLLLPLRRHYVHSQYHSDSIAADQSNRKTQKMAEFLMSETDKLLELGTFGFFVNHYKKVGNTSDSATIKIFDSFVNGMPVQSRDFVLNELPPLLSLVTKRYRNGACHTKPLEWNIACEFVDLIEDRGETKGLLQKIVTL